MIKKNFFLLLFSSFCHAQIKSKNDLYVIGYINENINYPKNWFVEFKADSINLISSNNELLSVLADNKVTRDFIVNLLSKKKDQSFTFKYKDEAGFDLNYTFFKAIKNVSVSKNASKILLNHTFETKIDKTFSSPNSDLQIKKSFTFSKDSLLIAYHYFLQNKLMYAEKELVPYKLIEKNKLLFFEIKLSKENDTKRLYQIIKLNNNSLSIVYYDQQEKITEKFKKSTLKHLPEKEFSVCLDSHPREYYFDNPDYTYTKGNNYILSKMNKNAPIAEGDGYITIHFTINCAKEIGRFGVEQMDLLYKPATYNPDLIKHLINEIALLKDWPNFVRYTLQHDVHAFFLFKIKNGKIVDVCP